MTNRNSSVLDLPGAAALDGTEVYYAVQNGADVQVSGVHISRPKATANATFYVSASGNDNNPGTAGSPCRTLQNAINIANRYDWQGVYFPTINVANGTYNEQVSLPVLQNCPHGGVITGNVGSPSSVIVADLGTDYAFKTASYSTWTVNGVKTSGTFGAYSIAAYSVLTFTDIVIGGNLSTAAINITLLGTFAGIGQNINVNATNITGALIFSRGYCIIDAVTINFANPITIGSSTDSVVSLDSIGSFFAFIGGEFTGATNVTLGHGSTNSLTVANGAFFEQGDTTLVDGVTLTRQNFPGGGGTYCDQWSTYMGDSPFDVEFPSNGDTVTTERGQKRLYMVLSGPIAALTVELPPQPFEGDTIQISSSDAISALTLTSPDGYGIGAPGLLDAGAGFELYFLSGINLWLQTVGPGNGETQLLKNSLSIDAGGGSANAVINLTGWNVGVSHLAQIYADQSGNLNLVSGGGQLNLHGIPSIQLSAGSGSAAADLTLTGWNAGVSTDAHVQVNFTGELILTTNAGQDILLAPSSGNVAVATAGAGSGTVFNNTSAGGKSYSLTSNGAGSGFGAGVFSIFDNTDTYGVLSYSNAGLGVNYLATNVTCVLGWANNQFAGGIDTGLARNAAGTVEVNTGTMGAFGQLVTASVRGNAVAFAGRPAMPVEGMMVSFTDSTTNVWGATIAGGGANHVLGYYNGINWTVSAK